MYVSAIFNVALGYYLKYRPYFVNLDNYQFYSCLASVNLVMNNDKQFFIFYFRYFPKYFIPLLLLTRPRLLAFGCIFTPQVSNFKLLVFICLYRIPYYKFNVVDFNIYMHTYSANIILRFFDFTVRSL